MEIPPLLFVLIDGWRHDLLSREATPFLAQLRQAGQAGSLVEPFGFAPGPAIFAGLWPDQAGYTHKFHYDPAGSPYRFTRWIPDLLHRLPRGPRLLERWIQQRAERTWRERGSTLSGSVWELRNVPLSQRRFFDLSEFHRPDAPGAFRTPGLFDRARAADLPYLYLGAPETTLETSAVMLAAESRLQADHRLLFAHFGEPDWVAHREGPGSAPHLAVLAEVDRAVSQLQALLEARCGGPANLLAFGDHGFLPVSGTVDVAAALDGRGLVSGRDYVAFLDSTTARLWFPGTDSARESVCEALGALSGLTRLAPEDARRYRVEFRGRRNWDACWVAEPGIVIHPDYFGGVDSPPTKGMHGYRPEVRDNHAAWLLSGPGEAVAAGLAEPLPMAGLHQICCGLLGLSTPSIAADNGRPYTVHADPAIDARIEADLSWIKSEFLERLPEMEGLLLTGGFARGEGTVVADGEGGIRPFNDYDLVLLHPDTPQRAALLRHSRTMAEKLGFRHLDVIALDRRELFEVGPQMFFVDLRAQGRVLHGEPDLLERIPPHPAASLSPEQVRLLLFNRLTCGLEDSSPALLTQRETSAEARFASDFMASKLVICAAQAMLMRAGRHALTLRDCIAQFSLLHVDQPKAVGLVERYGWFKLDPMGHPLDGSVADHWFESRDFYLSQIGVQFAVAIDDPQALIDFTRTHCHWSPRDRLRLAWHRLTGAKRRYEDNWGAHRKRDIEAAELLLMAAPQRDGYQSNLLEEAARRLAPHEPTPDRDWDSLRKLTVLCDYRWVHPMLPDC